MFNPPFGNCLTAVSYSNSPKRVDTSAQFRSPARKIGGMSDHVHILFRMSKNHALADMVEAVKTSSSKWIKAQSPALRAFHWQNGYGGFSLSPPEVEAVAEYIDRQEEHHRTVSFQEEYRKFLQTYGVEYDERYVWD
jgi:hypothetical protein